MLKIIFPAITLFVMTWLVDHLLKSKKYKKISYPQKTPKEVLELVRKYGNNSNSFMTLYSGFKYFSSSSPNTPGVIAFLDMPNAWVGGTEPIASPSHQGALLSEFAATAASIGKSVILLPVDQNMAKLALQVGFGSLMIGSEPTFDLESFPKTGKTWIDVVPTAKTLDSKGAKVVEFHPSTSTSVHKAELEVILQEWLRTRKMEPIGFLNKVEPWTLSENKRYFQIEYSGKILAFLAAIPIWPRKGWYLIDLMRRKEAPAGTTELLTLQAMKILRNSGALTATLGVSPLAEISKANNFPFAETGKHFLLYSFFRFLYRRELFYNFNSLYQYKLKFSPTSSEPVFVIFKNFGAKKSHFRFRDFISASQAFSRRNSVIKTTWSGILRSVRRIHLAGMIRKLLTNSVVVRSAPRTWTGLVYRCKFTLGMIFLNMILFFVTTHGSGVIFSEIEQEWAFSWAAFSHTPWRALLLSPFLHWNLLHLNTNLTTLLIFTGGLEYLAGSAFAFACYIVPMIFSNPITSFCISRFHFPTALEIDVGASLGIFGCAGALSSFLKHRWILVGSLCMITSVHAVLTQQWIEISHCTAVCLGMFVSFVILKR